ncbi:MULTISPECIES: hypothetical protein [unclassified Leeuwenhoekiella]|uniref:hypothetical protein n=1 Tax=unclassified Leeuwenhoekiella TaxID=2615029 RepID=UPI000C423A10|nr:MULTISPECIES: hypothetical protein [unclassified Leeuwenhoekiella]MAW95175.1 hypothetical protein [Leeuwenhoekiella sp.]MBA81902.1 hypothetical protein [Leeuwenhoekiella sp.]|tara:strand:- start:23205 stop:23813 length:609 start_codon:yes stop_codon:yes gene_type:complete
MESLTLFEQVFMYLGILMFVVLLGSLVFFVVKGKELKPLLLFFLMPILMIGYPSIQEIKYQEIWIKLHKSQQNLVENPADSASRRKVEALTNKIEARAHTEEQLNSITYSKILLQKPKEAEYFAEKALSENKNSETAKELKQVAQVQEELKIAKRDTATSASLDSSAVKQLEQVRLPARYEPINQYVLRTRYLSTQQRTQNN